MGHQAERLAAGDWYLDDEDLQQARRDCWRLVDQFNALGPDDDGARDLLLRTLFGHVGQGAVVMPRLQCSYGTNVSLGAGCFVNSNAYLMDDAPIDIGSHARVGPGVQLMTALHPVDDHDRRREGWERALPISVGADAWLGAGVIVCPGVTIGASSVVGAGSVVTRDVAPGVLVAGSPARIIRELG